MTPTRKSCDNEEDEVSPGRIENPMKKAQKQQRKKPNLKIRKRKVFRMTQEKLDNTLKALKGESEASHSGCFQSLSSKSRNNHPLLSYNRLLQELQNCADKQDWALFAKYILRLGTGHVDKRFNNVHLKMAIMGLAFDPMARKSNLLCEFMEMLMRYWRQEGFLPAEEATKRIFSIL